MNNTWILAFLLWVGLSSCGDKFGTCTTYYEDGETLRSKVPCNLSTGEKNGTMKVYKKNGDLWKTMVYVESKLEDTTKFYYSRTGELLKVVPMLHDKREGVSIEYYKNGQVKKEEGFKDNLRDGYKREYTEDGKLISEAFFVKGEQEKIATYYFEGTDQIREKISYKQGLRSGLYEKYDDKGRLVLRGTYRNGNPEGDWKLRTLTGGYAEGNIAELAYVYRRDLQAADISVYNLLNTNEGD